MSYIPDCRVDEHYNEKYLRRDDKIFISGYDMAVENISGLFSDLDCYQEDFDIEGEDINLIRFLKNHPRVNGMLSEVVKDWLETWRNEIITAMIDEEE